MTKTQGFGLHPESNETSCRPMQPTGRKILAVIPLIYRDDQPFWSRDMGLLVVGLRGAGEDANLVAIGSQDACDASLPLTLGTLSDMETPAWWQRQQPWGIILNTWSAPRYDRVRRAALAATPRVIEKLDTDGVRSPRIWPQYYWRATLGTYKDCGHPLKKTCAPFLALMRAGLTWLFPRMLDRRMATSMGMMPVVAAESPVASARIKRFIHNLNCSLPRVVTIPHPVADEYMRIDQNATRENRIICVGRWQTYQKNFPLLIAVLTHFLTEHPAWSADVIGPPPNRPLSIGKGAALVHKRLHFHGRVPHRDISRLYQKSKIFLMPSRFESFNIAAAEALCCGCSVVGANDVASVPFFTSQASGTGACRLTKAHLLDALSAEMEAWNTGQRDPEKISKIWRATVGTTAVSRSILRELENIGPVMPHA